ncbi:unnamed protein product [Brachionus calyciflorus]|uniref:Transporter n=1 Tax=Brachionus calyciflorus TaxID=104777 RepID=A0A814D2E3_9BILA|nr:unnamed protein product [Brachionus calyciflorus]
MSVNLTEHKTINLNITSQNNEVQDALIEEKDETEDLHDRDQWSNKIEYMLSVIGYVVDLGNCVRFPYVTYKNGGGAFLIPYFTFLILIGIPMMFLEMSIGQYFRVGNITLWGKVNRFMKGIGYSSLLVVCYITLYYATIISYSVFYLFASFRLVMPWSSCNNEWNSDKCIERIYENNSSVVNPVSPAEEYYKRFMLGIHKSTGIDDLGPIKLDLVVCLALVYLLMYLCICKGVKGTGKAVYVTATLPYIILVFLLVHGLTLSGSTDGVYYFLTPSFKKLTDFECWKDAAIQIFFTLGPGISVLTTYASYSKKTNNCQIDALSASIANVIASFLAGIVVFASLGHLSYEIGKPIEEVTTSDFGLSFIAYPEILATFKYSAFFSIIFFLMIINLGLDSGFGGLEAIYTALADEFKLVKKFRKSFMGIIHIALFLGSLPTVTYGGMYLVTFLDTFSTSPAIMLIVLFEAISVCWFYGVNKFSDNIYEMFKIRPNKFWLFCWAFASPIIIIFLFFISIFLFEEPTFDNYKYPKKYLIFGWIINISIMVPIPLFAIIKFLHLKIKGDRSL